MVKTIAYEQEKHFKEIADLIKKYQDKALREVNKELINLYWQVGEYIGKKVKASEWGKSVVEKLAEFLQETKPELKGFTSRNLWRMKQFYETYKDYTKLSTLWTQII